MTSTEARRRRIAHLQQMDAAVPGFWKARAEEAKERAESEPPRDPHDHGRLNLKRLISTCEPCAIKKIRWMAEESPYGFLRATGERYARDYGIEVNTEKRPEPPKNPVKRERPDTSGMPSLF